MDDISLTQDAETITRWHYVWRRMHCLGDMHHPSGTLRDEAFIDSGYCLDRYSLNDADRT